MRNNNFGLNYEKEQIYQIVNYYSVYNEIIKTEYYPQKILIKKIKLLPELQLN